ncbi:MAG: tripartite tricarboxylate transporter permease [Gammaproteobacteria bacterium]|nr:tripartite tricarboxylate transporter permease [Gammaproteobacteria bacterium]
MEASALEAAAAALTILLEPSRLAVLGAGVLVGLTIGVIPGLGGIVGLALLLPFTFEMDAYSAFAFLIGMGSVTTTSDTVPAVLFGVPGTTGSAATILDGHPLAKAGQAGRAFGAAYTASLLGGIAGAALLAVSIPILRPVILYLGSPELLAICIFGLSMVAVLSGKAPLKGMVAAGLGLVVAMVGSDPQTGTMRWTFDTLYLWDGLPLVPVTLGLFALPELADLAIGRRSIGGGVRADTRSGQLAGIRDALTHWWLVLRCSWLGAALGAVPGLGSAVIDWLAYGHALKTEKNTEGFGKGDIRGVIASESSNNAKEGGSLVPTIAFGVPGSASMAILLGAFMMHGLVPGPRMLTDNLEITYSIVWSIALANVLGAGLCLAFSNQLARVASIRIGLLLPVVLAIIFVGAFQGSRQWGDLYVLLGFGVFGWIMKQQGWPRPPLILGVVLGEIVERYLFISVGRYDWAWMTRPLVILFITLAVLGLVGPLLRNFRVAMTQGQGLRIVRPRLTSSAVFTSFIIAALLVCIRMLVEWNFEARIVPLAVTSVALLCAVLSLANELFLQPATRASQASSGPRGAPTDPPAASVAAQDNPRTVLSRAVEFFAWCGGYLVVAKLIGMLAAMFLFVTLCVRFWGREPLGRALLLATGVTAFSLLLFDQLLVIPWPQNTLGGAFPALQPYLK